MVVNHNCTTQDNLLRQTLDVFYDNPDNMRQMTDVITGNSDISLRIVDWFITNYSKKYYTTYNISEPANRRFRVYNDYKLKLKSYSKRRFDPFCRWNRIEVPYDTDRCMETTIGQMNFFKWIIEHGILDYIHAHYDEIEADMHARNTSVSNRKAGPSESRTRKKRREISAFAGKNIQKEAVNIIISFS